MENSSSSEPPLCPCGFWGSPKTLGLCSKCYNDHIARSSETLDGPDPRGGSQLGGEARQAVVVVPDRSVSAKMDNSSQHCPSRSSADSLGKQPGSCPDDQKDPKALPSSCASSSAAPGEDRTPSSPVMEAGGSCAPTASKSVREDNTAGSVTDGASVVKTKEESAAPSSSSQTVERCKGEALAQKSSELSGGCAGSGGGGGSELSAEPRVPSPHEPSSMVGSHLLPLPGGVDALSAVASSTEVSSVSSQGIKRSLEDSVDEEGRVKQKNKKRCFRCSIKLELAQREIGRCRCGGVFCSTHRHPEAHCCEFDHKEDGRREARQKMIKPTRHLGTSFRRLENS